MQCVHVSKYSEQGARLQMVSKSKVDDHGCHGRDFNCRPVDRSEQIYKTHCQLQLHRFHPVKSDGDKQFY